MSLLAVGDNYIFPNSREKLPNRWILLDMTSLMPPHMVPWIWVSRDYAEFGYSCRAADYA